MNAVHLVRRLRPFVWALSALALAAMGVWWWSPWTGADRGVTSTVSDAQPGLNTTPGLDRYPPGKRSPAPTLVGTTLDGKPFSLTDLAGNVVVINVWGSWCAPCRAETPDLVRVANEEADRAVRFVGINTRDNPDAAKAFVRSFEVPYPSVRDNNGEVLLSFRDTIPTTVVPTTVVIDRQGKVAARIIGPVTYRTLKGLLDDELASGGGR